MRETRQMISLPPILRRFAPLGECAVDLVFPWPESEADEPRRIEPPLCLRCGETVPAFGPATHDIICGRCQAAKHLAYAWARAAYFTQGQVREAILGFKYREESFQLRRLVPWLVEAYDRFAALDAPWHGLVPVPLYPRRFRSRGFNQATELARGLAGKRGVPLRGALVRVRETLTQATLDRKERTENMDRAFALKAGFDVKGQRLLIIDDVFTTGATANACAQALVKAGAARVAVLTVART